MRYISKDDVELALPDDWDDVVKQAWGYVAKKAGEAWRSAREEGLTNKDSKDRFDQARTKAINEKASSTWQYLAEYLAPISFDKCWYCECSETRSDMAVDHYRPKNKVEEDADHPGYWWLAFDWSNYRYSCTFCNSFRKKHTSTPGGKQCRFPLSCVSDRASKRAHSCDIEVPCLLDPFVRTDAKLLTFLTNGKPVPASLDKSKDHDRASVSIEVYHLDEKKINKDRQRLYQKIRRLVESISQNEDENLKAELLSLAKSNAEYSSSARIYIRQYKPNHAWIEELLEDL